MYWAKQFTQAISDWQCSMDYYGVIRRHTRSPSILWLNVSYSIEHYMLIVVPIDKACSGFWWPCNPPWKGAEGWG